MCATLCMLKTSLSSIFIEILYLSYRFFFHNRNNLNCELQASFLLAFEIIFFEDQKILILPFPPHHSIDAV